MDLPNTALTHGGKFHADDVFSAALLKILNPKIHILRAFEVPESFDGLVFDLGRGRFDHHQEDSEVRENGVPYAAFGLLWREFGKQIFHDCCTPEEAEREAAHFDETFIQPLDEDDNTGCGNPLASVIGSFNPNWDSDRSPDECFEEAVALAVVILNKKFEGVRSVLRAKTIVEDALAKSEDHIVRLPRFLPWKMVLIPSDAEFVVYPSQRGGYNAQVIPADFNTKEVKCNFPEAWAGKPAEELQTISGVGTLTFCHKGRFIISADRLEDAVKACKIAMAQKPKQDAEKQE
ncbi:MAG: MYG1 family protein [Ruminococcaceae bacterium]|nr:MYG1 family protein [Oscillospiraceae bacterium]HHV32140.1 MYG1 family protein [Clostridiales bacterium]